MADTTGDLQQQVDRVLAAAIDFGSAADAVTAGAARALGINRTDMRVVALLRRYGGTSAGRIAARSALSPAAATSVIRRLSDAGLVDQQPDPHDRRRTIVSLTPRALDRLLEIYGAMLEEGAGWLRGRDGDELDLLEQFLRRAEQLQFDLVDRLGGRAARTTD